MGAWDPKCLPLGLVLHPTLSLLPAQEPVVPEAQEGSAGPAWGWMPAESRRGAAGAVGKQDPCGSVLEGSCVSSSGSLPWRDSAGLRGRVE